jgi:hypothetical protein
MYNLNVSDDGVQHSESLGFWTLSVVRNSKYYNTAFLKPDLFSDFSKGPNRVDVSLPSPEDRNRSSFRNTGFCLFSI